LSLVFKPAFGLKNPHFQTLYASLFKKDLDLDLEVQRFILSDGDFVEAHWYKKPSVSTTKPIVILFHGLNGSYKSPYIQGMMDQCQKVGFSSVVMHFRGCSGVDNNLPRAYHSGDSGDANEWIKYVNKTYPNAKIFTVGYSLGGNMLLKLIAEQGDSCIVSGAVSVSAPLQLDISANRVLKGFSRFYQYLLIKDLNKALLRKFDRFDMSNLLLKKDEVNNLKTFWEFDGAYTAPMHNFKNAQDYYIKCSAKQFLKDIKIPTLIIYSTDDPFMTPEVLPTKEERSSTITLEVYNYGGHVGFVSGTILKPEYFLEKRIIEYFLVNDN